MTNNSDISRVVMRRVYVIRALRPFVSNAAGAVALMGISLYLIGREVFVAQVFRNAPHEVTGILNFFMSAFLNTSFVVQLLTILVGGAGVWLAREVARLLAEGFRYA